MSFGELMVNLFASNATHTYKVDGSEGGREDENKTQLRPNTVSNEISGRQIVQW